MRLLTPFLASVVVLMVGCTKNDIKLATVVTIPVSDITAMEATGGGEATSDVRAPVI